MALTFASRFPPKSKVNVLKSKYEQMAGKRHAQVPLQGETGPRIAEHAQGFFCAITPHLLNSWVSRAAPNQSVSIYVNLRGLWSPLPLAPSVTPAADPTSDRNPPPGSWYCYFKTLKRCKMNLDTYSSTHLPSKTQPKTEKAFSWAVAGHPLVCISIIRHSVSSAHE